jgi:beta-phosphoglucomutase
MMLDMQAAIFDLDGVIVDTAKYHYMAWRRLAQQLGFDFSEEDNEKLKGVSRMRSLELLTEIGGVQLDSAERERLSALKNTWYVEYINKIDPSEVLPGVVEYIRFVRSKQVQTAIASASRNAQLILDHLRIAPLFDAVVDGNQVHEAKPDPEVFLRAASALGVPPEGCVIFEDSEAGIEAARRAGMFSVGVGKPANLIGANMVIANFRQLLVLSITSPQQ